MIDESDISATSKVKLINLRTNLKQKLTKFENRLAVFNIQGSQTELTLRLEKIEEIWKEFDKVQTELELIDSSESEERDSFEDQYFRVIEQGQTYLQLLQSPQSVASNQTNKPFPVSSCSPILPALPSINIPIFSGSYESWVTFYQIFESVYIIELT